VDLVPLGYRAAIHRASGPQTVTRLAKRHTSLRVARTKNLG
jgi:hypothetical protein